MKGPIKGRIYRQCSRCLVVEFLEDRALLSAGALGPVAGGPTLLDHFSHSEMIAGWSGPGAAGQVRQAPADSQFTTGALPPADGAGASMPAPMILSNDQRAGSDCTNAPAVNCAPAPPVSVPAPPVVTLPPIDIRPPSGLGDQPPRSPTDNTNGVNRNLPTEAIGFLNTITFRLGNSSSGLARAPLVSQTRPTSPSIPHTVSRVATVLDTSASSQGGEAPSPLTVLQEAAAAQAAGEGLTPVRSEEVTVKEPASSAEQAPARGLLVQGETVANPVNSAAMRVRAGNREPSSWMGFPEKGASPVRPLEQAVPGAARDTLAHRAALAGKRLAPPLPDLIEIVTLSSKAAVALETGLPLDLVLLRQEVDTFFAHLASHPEAGERFQTYLRFAPWLALLGGAAAFEFARRWDRKSSPRTASEDEAVFGPVAFLPEKRQ
jgi:hypothetical protein